MVNGNNMKFLVPEVHENAFMLGVAASVQIYKFQSLLSKISEIQYFSQN